MDYQKQLDQWFQEDFDKPNNMVEYVGFTALDSNVAGLCTGYSDGSSKIKLTSKFEDKENYAIAVLWHEYCHSYTWYKSHEMGHGLAFITKQLSKPTLFFMDIVAAFAYQLMRCKE